MKIPEKIFKLALYLLNKEPLIYLFILNSKFIRSKPEKSILKSIGENVDDYYNEKTENLPILESSCAAVSIRNGVLYFLYTDYLLKLSMENLYFIVVHEAFHIFKKHLTNSLTSNLFSENHMFANIAADMVINEEINSINFIGKVQPSSESLNAYFVPEEFKEENKDLGKDAYTTQRLFDWLKQKNKNAKKLTKRELINMTKMAKNTKTGKYEYAINETKKGFETESYDNTKELLERSELDGKNSGGNSNGKSHSEKDINDLIPVVPASCICKNGMFNPTYEGDLETISNEMENSTSKDSEEKDFSSEGFTKDMIEKAEEMIENNSILKNMVNPENASNRSGDSFLFKIKEIIKPKINWKRELRRNINIYNSKNSSIKTKKDSILTYLANPKSVGDLMFRHYIKKRESLSRYILIAMDTSGSLFGDTYETRTFFAEMNEISKQMNFSNDGRILLFQWGTRIEEDFVEYKLNDWKNFKTKGCGGTDPSCIFDFLEKRFEKINSRSLFLNLGRNINEKLLIPDKRKLPFIIVLTDGYFCDKLTKDQLKLYKNFSSNILFITRETKDLFSGAKFIKF